MSREWLWAPVILASLEAEVGELLEPGRQRLQSAEIAPLHSILGDRVRLCLKKKKKKKTTIEANFKDRCPLPSFRAHPCITCHLVISQIHQKLFCEDVRVRACGLLLILIIRVV
uniref:Uncharacterized protein n=1 Tax=Macaca fascicularis TaxID=9541 RepID=Q95JH8_MACFA|nr:hypothetical protein [Macaca fascicularis]